METACSGFDTLSLHDALPILVGALRLVYQYVRIGAHSYIGGGTTITRDVLPFSKTSAAREAKAYGMNTVGLERRRSEEHTSELQSRRALVCRLLLEQRIDEHA